ncbi:MAG: methylated-DNA--[protein]-cysteine S-methyltransferase [Vicinamibacterales bacterium]
MPIREQAVIDGQHTQSSAWFIEHIPTPIGTMVLLTDDAERVRALDWDDHLPRMVRLLQRQYSSPHIALDRYRERKQASRARTALERYFAGDIAALDRVGVETGGTPFQRTVWAALRRIPAGQTTSYGALASTIDRPRAMRAVGLANGSNPIGIIVPCHRVIGASGALTGYGGGLARKQWLLEHEGAIGR